MKIPAPQTEPPSSTPDALEELRAELGPLVTSRRASAVDWIFALLTLGLSAFLAFVSISANSPRDRMEAILFAVASGLMFWLFAFLLLRLFRTFEFREFGAIVFRGGKVLSRLRYEDCTRFRYELTRNYVNGVYAGTSLVITLADHRKRKITWSGRHKEKPQGFAFVGLSKKFRGEDELDVVKILIADEMADRWTDRLLSGERIRWGTLMMARACVTPLKGRSRHVEIPHHEIDRFAMDQGRLRLFRTGEDKPFFSMLMNEENFWPGMRVMERAWAATAANVTGDDRGTPESRSTAI